MNFLDSFTNWASEKLIPPLVKIGGQRHLTAVRNGLTITLPAIICGSVFLIIGNLPIDAWLKLIEPYQSWFDAAVNASIGIIALMAVIGISYDLARSYSLNAISASGLALVAFILTQYDEELMINVDGFGSGGLFTAIISAFISVEIYHFCVKKDWVIKMPDGVPPAVSHSFISLIPCFITLMLFWVVRVPLHFNINAFIQAIFSPLVFALNSLPGIMVYTLLVSLLWCAGIHGDMTLEGVADPIFIQFVTANAAAYQKHLPLPYITASGFSSLFVNVGGTGATLVIVLLMLFSKSKAYKQLGKISLPSALFEINEPVIFGFPIVMNPIMMIPFVLVPLILATLSYIVMAIGLVTAPITMIPWTMPPIIGPLLATGWDWRAAIWSAVEIVIALIIYYPFFKMAEKQMIDKEISESAKS